MNIYARYFDQDILVHTFEELIDFLSSIPDIPITQTLVDDVRNYMESDMPYPKRYKIRPRVYFIMIKTTADTMEEFKSYKRGDTPALHTGAEVEGGSHKEIKSAELITEKSGWYKGHLYFKRVIQNPITGKFQYQDANFAACVWAESPYYCYAQIVEHLKNRQDIDPRSQFPSARGSNFSYEYYGEVCPFDEAEAPAGHEGDSDSEEARNFGADTENFEAERQNFGPDSENFGADSEGYDENGYNGLPETDEQLATSEVYSPKTTDGFDESDNEYDAPIFYDEQEGEEQTDETHKEDGYAE